MNKPTLEDEKQLKYNKIKHNLANPLGEKDTGKKDKVGLKFKLSEIQIFPIFSYFTSRFCSKIRTKKLNT